MWGNEEATGFFFPRMMEGLLPGQQEACEPDEEGTAASEPPNRRLLPPRGI